MNDLIQVIKVLDDKDLKIINDHIDTLTFIPSTVFTTGGKSKEAKHWRTSTGTALNDSDDVTNLFHEKINAALVEYKERISLISANFKCYPVPGGYETDSYREEIQILEYSPDQEYKFHHDAATNPNIKAYHRKISIIVYLTDKFTGGHTAFPHCEYRPEPGHALIFPSNWCYPHAGKPVLEGKKRIAVTWYYANDRTC
tara:strand:+ start:1241 stop:1837 length:597 start_codon:yes stop_codon:yes gene_type:complete